jgi:1-acyl-sn-glycerol-3-phosphate acyltransferase
MKVLTSPAIKGQENYPKEGSLIVVANHSGLLETVYMTCFAPRQIEYMGSVDLPHEKILALFMNAYKFIPVFRGNVSLSAMKDGVSVLKQGGVIGIFPEGGIWESAIRKAHSGVAWLSYHGNAPILPIGFTPTAGTVSKALSFKRPVVEMKVGTLIPPVTIEKGKSKKVQFNQAAQMIMDAVWDLVPRQNRSDHPDVEYERFEFHVTATSADNLLLDIPDQYQLLNGASLSKILYRTTLINNFRDNLHMDITPLKNLDQHPTPEKLISATSQILSYLESENPYYFTYRYGQGEGTQMRMAIQELHDLADWALRNDHKLQAQPIRRYKYQGVDNEIIETHPTELAKW